MPAGGTWLLSVVEFGTDEFEPAPCDAVGAAIRRRNRLVPFQLSKQVEIDARVMPAVAGQAFDGGDPFLFVLFDFNATALRKQVQDALFSARNIPRRSGPYRDSA